MKFPLYYDYLEPLHKQLISHITTAVGGRLLKDDLWNHIQELLQHKEPFQQVTLQRII